MYLLKYIPLCMTPGITLLNFDLFLIISNYSLLYTKDYLITRGINADRIITSEFGETSPIAKNDVNGKDSPSGRQYNRRVVVTVMRSNGIIVPNVVQPIDVPEALKAN